MNATFRFKKVVLLLTAFVLNATAKAQVSNWQENHHGSLYISFGYAKQWYSRSNIYINQGANNSYTLQNVKGTDLGPANDPYSLAHYAWKAGYLFNYSQNLGLELSWDPCRYYVPDNQNVSISGTLDGTKVNGNILFSRMSGYYYGLEKGSGSFSLNLVKRFGLYRKISHKFTLDAVVKGGMGILMPSFNYELGNAPGSSLINVAKSSTGSAYQFEAGIRWTTQRHYYLELDYKLAKVSFDNIAILNGSLAQEYVSNSITLNAGGIFSVTKHNPLFTKGWPHRKEIKHPHAMYKTEEDY